MKIGVCDSGIGGLTVLNELVTSFPNCDYFYYGDTKHLPYGEKTKKELVIYGREIISYFEQYQVDLIVVACGTLSANIKDEMKAMSKIPIVDILSPTIRYLKEKSYDSVGVFATSMTIQSRIFEKELPMITSVACPKFVPMIEKNEMDFSICDLYLKEMKEKEIKHIVLGCTHYPLLRSILEARYPIDYIDMGKVLVKTLKIKEGKRGSVTLHFSKLEDTLLSNIERILTVTYQMK